MNQILYERRCKCREKFSVIKKRKRSEGKTHKYCNLNELNEMRSKLFQIKYEKKLSPIAKLLLHNFQNKYFYYAIDDILYLLKSNPSERDNLLEILYSTVLSLQNNFFIDFFDIWISEIYINEPLKVNKFLTKNPSNFEKFSYITIKLFYKIKTPKKEQESLW